MNTSHNRKKKRYKGLLLTALVTVVLLGGGIFLKQSLDTPLRKLQNFPVEDYYENHASLEGSHFRAKLQVGDQLGWKKGRGRLVVFKVYPSLKPVVALVPEETGNTSFDLGTTYSAEIIVGEQGLLEVAYLNKN